MRFRDRTDAGRQLVRQLSSSEIVVPHGVIHGDLVQPDGARSIVVFAHGSGSSRHSPRNRRVAAHLHEAGFGTLLLDLLTEAEEREDLRTAKFRFDIELLADRLGDAVAWLDQRTSAPLDVGYFGASTGAAAALVASARQRTRIGAVVSRGGRPDLAGDELPRVEAPTLLIVGDRDPTVLELNRVAAAELRCEYQLEVVAGATHLFEEPGALDEVADLATGWFTHHLAAPRSGIDRGERGA